MPTLGTTELIVIFVIVLIIFGPKSLPKIGKSLGKGIRDFKDAASGMVDEEDDEDEADRKDEKLANHYEKKLK